MGFKIFFVVFLFFLAKKEEKIPIFLKISHLCGK